MFHEDGGEMKTNTQAGNTSCIYEIEGVHYIKIKVGDVPDDQPTTCDNKLCAVQTPEDLVQAWPMIFSPCNPSTELSVSPVRPRQRMMGVQDHDAWKKPQECAN